MCVISRGRVVDAPKISDCQYRLRRQQGAKRDGVDFNLASIGDDFDVPCKGLFDKEYMQTLFAYGYQKGRAGYPWQKLRQVRSIKQAAALETRTARCYASKCEMRSL